MMEEVNFKSESSLKLFLSKVSVTKNRDHRPFTEKRREVSITLT